MHAYGERVAGRDGAAEAARLLSVVRELADELHATRPPARVAMESELDRDLGLDSLALVELCARVEDEFGVRLPERLLATVATPADLLAAVLAAPSGRRRERRIPRPARRAVPGPLPVAVPERSRTLLEALAWQVAEHPDRLHLRVLGEDEEGDTHITYAALDREARAVARNLASAGIEPAEMVAIMLPTSGDFFVAFMGVVMAGAVPVPLYPPSRPARLEEHLRRQVGILENAQASALVTTPEIRPIARLLRSHVPSLHIVATPQQLSSIASSGWWPPSLGDEDVALLQYTSGSTASPKGVVLSHANLLANLRAMGSAAAVSPGDVFVSWLPLYHDMGLIGAWLGSLYHGFPLIVLSPLAFLARPARWLWAIHEHGGTLSAAPNFGYELAWRKIRDNEVVGLDLSGWRLAFNGAEAVSADTLEQFHARFAPYGLRWEALTPVYGLAEAAVGLTFPPPGRGPVIDQISREALVRSGRAAPAPPPDVSALRVVSCGRPVPGHRIRIVDIAGHEVPDRHEGRVQFAGPSATRGYFRDEAGTRRLFRDGWLETGDLGYVAGGELYVTGRIKELIIRAGRNVHPDELEHALGEVPGVRRGCVAAFASPDPATGTERLVILAEARSEEPHERDEIRRQIVSRTTDLVGIPPDDVVVAPPGTVLKTSSGKIRRAASRQLYETGRLRRRAGPVWLQLLRFGASGVIPQLRRWRRAARAGAANVALWLAAAVVVLPMGLAVLVMPGRRLRRRIARRAAKLLVGVGGRHLDVTGTELLPRRQAYVVVANHASALDAFVLSAILPPDVTFVAASEFATQRLAGTLLRRIGTLFVERDRVHAPAAVDALAAVLVQGQPLVVFPEGGLSPTPGLRPFHLGPFLAACRVGAPVVPVAIRGTRGALRPGFRFLQPARLRAHVAPPVAPRHDGWRAALAVQHAARRAVLAYCGEPDLA